MSEKDGTPIDPPRTATKIGFLVVLRCADCGYETTANGREVHHRTGTKSFLVYNVNRACPICGLPFGGA